MSEHTLGRSETLSGIVRQGNRQLVAQNNIPASYKILLFLADCANRKVVIEQVLDTLYGKTTVIEMKKNGV